MNRFLNLRLPLPRFVSAGEIFAGSGAVGALRVLDAARVAALVSPTVLARHEDTLRRSLGGECVEFIAMPRGEPTLDGLAPVLARLEQWQPDWIVAVGGGSTLDGAKVAWTLYEHPGIERERLFRLGGVPTLRGKARFAALPTTAGTGSEVSASALVLDGGTKRALVSLDLLPDIAVLDPRLAVGCPASVITAAGLDALAHAVESYVSRLANPLADLLAEKAAAEVFATLPCLVNEPDDETLTLRMMNAALLAGWVQNQKIPGLGHAIAHQLGALGVGHGQATGCLLAAAVEVNARDDQVRARYDYLGRTLGVGDCGGLVAAIRDLTDALPIERLPEAVFADIDRIATGAAEDPCERVNPVPVSHETVAAVLEASR